MIRRAKTPKTTFRGAVAFALAALVACVAVAGCGIKFKFGEPPKVAARKGGEGTEGASGVSACYERNRIHVRRAMAGWADRSSPGDVNVERHYTARGLTFYVKGRRVSARELMELLAHPGLLEAYAPKYERPARKGFVRKLAGWILLGTAAGGLGAGTGLLVAGVKKDPRDKGLVWGGATAIIVGCLAAIPGGHLLRSGYRYSNLATAYETLFIASDLKDKLSSAVDFYNQQVLQKCQAAAGQ